MEIRDVIGTLREKDLDLQNQINSLKLAIHLCEYRLSKMDSVSRETKGDNDNGDQTTIFDALGSEAPSAEAGVGEAPLAAPRRPRRAAKHLPTGEL